MLFKNYFFCFFICLLRLFLFLFLTYFLNFLSYLINLLSFPLLSFTPTLPSFISNLFFILSLLLFFFIFFCFLKTIFLLFICLLRLFLFLFLYTLLLFLSISTFTSLFLNLLNFSNTPFKLFSFSLVFGYFLNLYHPNHWVFLNKTWKRSLGLLLLGISGSLGLNSLTNGSTNFWRGVKGKHIFPGKNLQGVESPRFVVHRVKYGPTIFMTPYIHKILC